MVRVKVVRAYKCGECGDLSQSKKVALGCCDYAAWDRAKARRQRRVDAAIKKMRVRIVDRKHWSGRTEVVARATFGDRVIEVRVPAPHGGKQERQAIALVKAQAKRVGL